MASDNGQDSVLGFRPTPALRRRLDAARANAAEQMDLQLSSVTNQLLIPWLLNRALDALGVPRAEEQDR